MTMKRIQVCVDEEIGRRIELAAVKHDVTVDEYCLDAIVQRLADEDMLEREPAEILNIPTQEDDTLIGDLQALREKILARRKGVPIEVDIVNLVRAERDNELLGVR